MDFLSAACLSVGILSFGLGISAASRSPARIRLIDRLLARCTRELTAARITTNPVGYLAVLLAAPPVLFAIGWLESPVLALAAATAGLLAPRIYVAWLVHLQSRRSEAEAARLLQALTAGQEALTSTLYDRPASAAEIRGFAMISTW
jgi:hypothetical protein